MPVRVALDRGPPMVHAEARRAVRPPIARLAMILALVSVLGGCASLRGVLVPVGGTVAGASQVDMLVATTRKRTDPAEMFSGARGPTPAFANITVSIPPPSARQIGEVQWPRQVPGNPATDFVTLKADVVDRTRHSPGSAARCAPRPSGRCWSSSTASTTASTMRSSVSRRSCTIPMRQWCRSCSPGPRGAACSPTAMIGRARPTLATPWRSC